MRYVQRVFSTVLSSYNFKVVMCFPLLSSFLAHMLGCCFCSVFSIKLLSYRCPSIIPIFSYFANRAILNQQSLSLSLGVINSTYAMSGSCYSLVVDLLTDFALIFWQCISANCCCTVSVEVPCEPYVSRTEWKKYINQLLSAVCCIQSFVFLSFSLVISSKKRQNNKREIPRDIYLCMQRDVIKIVCALSHSYKHFYVCVCVSRLVLPVFFYCFFFLFQIDTRTFQNDNNKIFYSIFFSDSWKLINENKKFQINREMKNYN